MSSLLVRSLLDKAAAGERLCFSEGLQVYLEAELTELMQTADTVRHMRLPGHIVTYLVDRQIKYTNVCVSNCHFCGFHRAPDHAEAFVLTREELAEEMESLVQQGCTRVLMQGGNNPQLALDWYTDLLAWMRTNYPTIERDCFSPSEIAHLAERNNMSIRDVLKELYAAGLQGVPGSGADMLDDQIRGRVSPRKPQSRSWLTVMREAQKLGLNTTASMVIGFGETIEQRIHHLLRLRSLQDYSLREHGSGFNAFVAWTLQPRTAAAHADESNGSAVSASTSSAEEYLRLVSLARLFLDNVLHHQAHCRTQGAKVAQIALHCGMDDFGGTMFSRERHAQGAGEVVTARSLTEGNIHAFIHETGYIPARRDSVYNLLHVFDNPLASPPPEPLPDWLQTRAVGMEGYQDIIPLQASWN